MIEKTRAFILRIINNKDDGKILILFTEKMGKITAFAYIPERINSIALSTYEVGNAVEVVLYKKKENENYTVSQISLIKQYPNIRFDYDKYRVLNYVLKTILRYTEENIEDKQLMNFLKLYMNFLNNTQMINNNLIFFFDYYFLHIQGLIKDLLCDTEEEQYLMENLNKQVILDDKLSPYITKNLRKQVSEIKQLLG